MLWRRRIGEVAANGCSRAASRRPDAPGAGVVKIKSFDAVVVDTTVLPKAIAHPTDSHLLNRAREQLIAAAQKAGFALRQSYVQIGKAAEGQAECYAHAKQYRRMQRSIRQLRTWLGRVIHESRGRVLRSPAHSPRG